MPANDLVANANKTRGFRPKDFQVGGDFLNGHGDNLEDGSKFAAYDGSKLGTTKDMFDTKLCLDLLSAPNADAAIDLAFFGKSFYKVDGTFTKDDDRYDGEIYKLHCKEVEGQTEE